MTWTTPPGIRTARRSAELLRQNCPSRYGFLDIENRLESFYEVLRVIEYTSLQDDNDGLKHEIPPTLIGVE